MNDKQILDWIEKNVSEIFCPMSGGVRITVEGWADGTSKEVTGKNLREAVRKAAGQTAVSEETS